MNLAVGELRQESRVLASPLARRLAREAGVELEAIAGSGPGGRIRRQDFEAFVASRAHPGSRGPAAQNLALSAVASSATLPEARATASTDARKAEATLPALRAVDPDPGREETPSFSSTDEPLRLSPVRAQFWQRVAQSKPAVPHFYLTVDCAIDRLLELQGDLNRRIPGLGPELTIDDFILRAAALSLVEYPRANAVWYGDHIRLYRSVDIAFVVGSSDGSAMPVLRDAGGKGLSAIASESRALAAKVQDRTLAPELCEGGSFTIFNLAAHGIRTFQAIIPTPHACALAIGAPQQAVVVRDGKIAQATIMSCSLSVDHRVVDGSLGAELLAAFKRRIEDPLIMLL